MISALQTLVLTVFHVVCRCESVGYDTERDRGHLAVREQHWAAYGRKRRRTVRWESIGVVVVIIIVVIIMAIFHYCHRHRQCHHHHCHFGLFGLLPPATKLRQGNVFTPVCHSVTGGLPHPPGQTPPAQCMLGYTHPLSSAWVRISLI